MSVTDDGIRERATREAAEFVRVFDARGDAALTWLEERFTAALRSVRDETRLEDAKAVCEECGVQSKFWHPSNHCGGYHLHIEGHQEPKLCAAWPILRLKGAY